MRTFAALAGIALLPWAVAHPMQEGGTVLVPTGNLSELEPLYEFFSVVDSVAAAVLPPGIAYVRIADVQGGDRFELEAYDNTVVGCGDPPCPLVCLERDDRGQCTEWIDVRNDFDIHFTGGFYWNGVGDEGGVVPGDGDAFVILWSRDPRSGPFSYGFVYTEDFA